MTEAQYFAEMDEQITRERRIEQIMLGLLDTTYQCYPLSPGNFCEALDEAPAAQLAQIMEMLQSRRYLEAGRALRVLAEEYWHKVAREEAENLWDVEQNEPYARRPRFEI